MAPIPAPSRTISRILLKEFFVAIWCLEFKLYWERLLSWERRRPACLLRRVITVAGSNLSLVFDTLYFQANSTILSVPRLVAWIVAKTVESSQISCDSRKRGTGIVEILGHHTPATRHARQIIHFLARQIVEFATDRHPFKRSHR